MLRRALFQHLFSKLFIHHRKSYLVGLQGAPIDSQVARLRIGEGSTVGSRETTAMLTLQRRISNYSVPVRLAIPVGHLSSSRSLDTGKSLSF